MSWLAPSLTVLASAETVWVSVKLILACLLQTSMKRAVGVFGGTIYPIFLRIGTARILKTALGS